MLHTISWKEYFTLMGLGFALYYGWWLVRYYPSLRAGGMEKAGRGRTGMTGALPAEPVGLVTKTEPAKARPVVAETGEVIGKPDQAIPVGVQETNQQLELPLPALPVPALIPQPVFLPVLAGDLRNAVMRLVGKVCEERTVEGELVFVFQQLLGKEPYSKLRGTLFEEKISALIVSELERQGSIHFGAEVVRGWWK